MMCIVTVMLLYGVMKPVEGSFYDLEFAECPVPEPVTCLWDGTYKMNGAGTDDTIMHVKCVDKNSERVYDGIARIAIPIT